MSQQTSIEDAFLVLQCQQGDAQSLATLVDRWQPRLLRHADRLTGNREAARDVVQETWMAVVKGLSRLDDAEAFGAWAFRIVTNKCGDWVRKQQRHRDATDRLARETRNDEAIAQGQDQRFASVHEAMASLPSEQHMLLALYYLEEFSVSEIAEIIAVPEGTVKSRLFHARNRLRQYLEDTDHESR